MGLELFSDEYFMKEALKEAQKALEKEEVPIGAVVVFQQKIIARAHNYTEALSDATAHAEMQAITSAADYLGGKYLRECTLYVTLEPCVMCAGATAWAQISNIMYGASDLKKGYLTTASAKILHPKTKVKSGLMEKKCGEILSDFFKHKRNR